MPTAPHWDIVNEAERYVGVFKKKFPPGGSGPSSQVGGWMEKERVQKKNFIICIHIWTPQTILSIWSIHNGVKTKFYPPLATVSKKENSGPSVPKVGQLYPYQIHIRKRIHTYCTCVKKMEAGTKHINTHTNTQTRQTHTVQISASFCVILVCMRTSCTLNASPRGASTLCTSGHL